MVLAGVPVVSRAFAAGGRTPAFETASHDSTDRSSFNVSRRTTCDAQRKGVFSPVFLSFIPTSGLVPPISSLVTSHKFLIAE
jgi:hypothetical protein